jgi:hypothetical protein
MPVVGKPWWWRDTDADDIEMPLVIGAEGHGKVLVTTRRDQHGDPIEQTWMSLREARNLVGWRRVQ